MDQREQFVIPGIFYTVEPRYNKDLWTMKITLS